MTEQFPVPPEPARPRSGSASAADVIAILLTVIWVVLVGGFFLFTDSTQAGSGGVALALTLVAIILPVALIWVAAITARTARTLREETTSLRASLDSMRQAYVAQAQAQAAIIHAPPPRAAIPAPAPAPESAQSPMTIGAELSALTFHSRRDATTKAPAAGREDAVDQPSLALGTRVEDAPDPLPVADLIKAFNFPDSPTDKDGFRALRRALESRDTAKLIRAAQDVLTLLSQDGIYMDDLTPDRARPEIWRRFAQGERGRTVAALGGVRDRSSLALTAARMRQDTIFRDTAHHFLRQFDRSFADFERAATDLEVASLADTRTARAFMLLGRVTGIFD